MVNFMFAANVYNPSRNPESGAEMKNVAALLDSAADQTRAPDAVAVAIGLN